MVLSGFKLVSLSCYKMMATTCLSYCTALQLWVCVDFIFVVKSLTFQNSPIRRIFSSHDGTAWSGTVWCRSCWNNTLAESSMESTCCDLLSCWARLGQSQRHYPAVPDAGYNSCLCRWHWPGVQRRQVLYRVYSSSWHDFTSMISI